MILGCSHDLPDHFTDTAVPFIRLIPQGLSNFESCLQIPLLKVDHKVHLAFKDSLWAGDTICPMPHIIYARSYSSSVAVLMNSGYSSDTANQTPATISPVHTTAIPHLKPVAANEGNSDEKSWRYLCLFLELFFNALLCVLKNKLSHYSLDFPIYYYSQTQPAKVLTM